MDPTSRPFSTPLTILDHLVYATPSLENTITVLEKTLGMRAAAGGRHPGRGTRNALIAISDSSYLEIIGPDEFSADRAGWFGIESLAAPRLVTWALRTTNIQDRAADAERRGIRFGPVITGSRERTDGQLLRWHYTDPAIVLSDGIVPFLIDWGDSPHPAASAPRGPELAYLRAEHPKAVEVQRVLAALDIDLSMSTGPCPALIAGFKTSQGRVIELK